MACCRVFALVSTDRGSIPNRVAVPVMRLFCRSFGGRSSAVTLGVATAGKVGVSVRGELRVRTYSNVGAYATRLLGSIVAGGILFQSRKVAKIDV
jgi:hypothetical protein